MKKVPQIFLFAFLADGLLSLAAVGIPALSGLQAIVAFAVFLAAAFLHIVMLCTPRLPKRLLIPATIFAIWCALTNAFPLSLWLGTQSQLILSCAQTFLGAGLLFLLFRRQNHPVLLRPSFTWANFATVSLVNFSLALCLAVLLVLSGLSMVEEKTAGYVRIRPEGISLEERWFQRADGKSVRLVGMVHVAKGQFYDDLQATLPEKESAIVLLEGITDHDSLLKERLNYNNLADSLGLESQTDSEFMQKAAKKSVAQPEASIPDEKTEVKGIQYWQADVDTSDFQSSTLACIEAVGSLFSSQTLGEVMQKMTDPESPLNQESGSEAFWFDIIEMRNEHLIGQMKKALLQTNMVVVPWGALHMPVFEKQLTDWGFYETHRVRRLAFSFQSKVLSSKTSSP